MPISKHHHRGFTLFIAVITVSIVLAIGISILNITLKEYQLSGLSRDSEIAFYAADAGLECALYWDTGVEPPTFDPLNTASRAVTCMGSGPTIQPDGAYPEQYDLEYSWGTPSLCARVRVIKFQNTLNYNGATYTCVAGFSCTIIESRGYNRGCTSVATDPRTVERALRTRY